MSTDDFFKINQETFDVIFIDASHNFEQVKKDFNNVANILNNNGIIFLHDTDPMEKKYIQEGYCSDSYKMNRYLESLSEFNFITIPIAECGMSIVKRKQQDRFTRFI